MQGETADKHHASNCTFMVSVGPMSADKPNKMNNHVIVNIYYRKMTHYHPCICCLSKVNTNVKREATLDNKVFKATEYFSFGIKEDFSPVCCYH